MNSKGYFPTKEHLEAAEVVVNYFSGISEVESVLLICSCARGKASSDSCLDMAVLVKPDLSNEEISGLKRSWEQFHDNEIIFKKLREVGKYANVEVDIIGYLSTKILKAER